MAVVETLEEMTGLPAVAFSRLHAEQHHQGPGLQGRLAGLPAQRSPCHPLDCWSIEVIIHCNGLTEFNFKFGLTYLRERIQDSPQISMLRIY